MWKTCVEPQLLAAWASGPFLYGVMQEDGPALQAFSRGKAGTLAYVIHVCAYSVPHATSLKDFPSFLI